MKEISYVYGGNCSNSFYHLLFLLLIFFLLYLLLYRMITANDVIVYDLFISSFNMFARNCWNIRIYLFVFNSIPKLIFIYILVVLVISMLMALRLSFTIRWKENQISAITRGIYSLRRGSEILYFVCEHIFLSSGQMIWFFYKPTKNINSRSNFNINLKIYGYDS